MNIYKQAMADLLTKMGCPEPDALANLLVEVAEEQKRQRAVHSLEQDNKSNVHEWGGYFLQTYGKGLERPFDPQRYRTQTIHAIALLLGAVMSVDRNPDNIRQK
jgi:hypothetical protein